MRKPDYNRRVVVTGLGVVSPLGNDVDTVWANLTAGKSGIAEITHFDSTPYEHHAGGEVRDFDITRWWNFKDARRTETTVHFAVASAKIALEDSGLEITDENRYDIGVIYGSGGGGQGLFINNQEVWHTKGVRSVSPFFIANGLVDASSGTIAIETGAKGHNFCPVSACSTGTHAIGEAAEVIRRGDCTAVIVDQDGLAIGLLGELQVRHYYTSQHPASYAVDRLVRLVPADEQSMLSESKGDTF